MTVRTLRGAAALALGLALTGTASAGDVVWRAAAPSASATATATAPAPASPWRPVAPSAADGPRVVLGAPTALPGEPVPLATPAADGLAAVDFREPLSPFVARAQAPPDPPPPAPPGPPPVPPPPAAGVFDPSVETGQPLRQPFYKGWAQWFQGGEHASATNRCLFQSDHCFDYLASPVTNPFFFEDPRALTELRPIFIYQTAPSGNPVFRGGHSEFFGTQARVAFTERLSLVMNEFGLVSLHPNNPSDDVSRGTGFAQVNIGPKYTFFRSPETRSLAAVGLTFQVPIGSSKVAQDTGDLGLDPYLSFAHSFLLPSGFGAINFIGNTGYSFATDNQRSEFYHASLHLDYNIARTNFYPFIEANWFHYTKAGRARDVGFEGVDLVNFGSSTVGPKDVVLVATGLRYKFSECLQVGVGGSWPVTRHQDLTDFRLTVDVIFRY